ncbi:MAG TPA: hypothetical protein VFK46_08275 [Candidatus Macondimonas sp.]|nr:hypothetical protein [Candidatus Macondimonas sp.]
MKWIIRAAIPFEGPGIDPSAGYFRAALAKTEHGILASEEKG